MALALPSPAAAAPTLRRQTLRPLNAGLEEGTPVTADLESRLNGADSASSRISTSTAGLEEWVQERRFYTEVDIARFAVSPDRGKVACSEPPHRLVVRAVPNGNRLFAWNVNQLRQVQFSPDGKFLLVAASEGLFLIDASTGAQIRALARSTANTADFSPPAGGPLITAGEFSALLSCWRLDRIGHLQEPAAATANHSRAVSQLVAVEAPDGDGNLIAVVGNSPRVALYRISSAQPAPNFKLLRWLETSGDVAAVALPPKGQRLAAAAGSSITLWDLQSGINDRMRSDTVTHSSRVTQLAFSPDGATLAAVGEDGSIRLWNVGDLTQFQQILPEDKNKPYSGIAFIPQDGRFIALEGNGGTFRLFKSQRRAAPPPTRFSQTFIQTGPKMDFPGLLAMDLVMPAGGRAVVTLADRSQGGVLEGRLSENMQVAEWRHVASLPEGVSPPERLTVVRDGPWKASIEGDPRGSAQKMLQVIFSRGEIDGNPQRDLTKLFPLASLGQKLLWLKGQQEPDGRLRLALFSRAENYAVPALWETRVDVRKNADMPYGIELQLVDRTPVMPLSPGRRSGLILYNGRPYTYRLGVDGEKGYFEPLPSHLSPPPATSPAAGLEEAEKVFAWDLSVKRQGSLSREKAKGPVTRFGYRRVKPFLERHLNPSIWTKELNRKFRWVVYEGCMNLAMHPSRGTVEFYRLKESRPGNIARIKVRFVNKSGGVIQDPNETYRVSSEQQRLWREGKLKSAREKMGFSILTDYPDRVIIESGGKKWARRPKARGGGYYFRYLGPTDIQSTVITEYFNAETDPWLTRLYPQELPRFSADGLRAWARGAAPSDPLYGWVRRLSPSDLEELLATTARAYILFGAQMRLIAEEVVRDRSNALVHHKLDKSAVTDVERSVQAQLNGLIKQFESMAGVGEEGSAGARDARYVVLSDPVDGTDNFIRSRKDPMAGRYASVMTIIRRGPRGRIHPILSFIAAPEYVYQGQRGLWMMAGLGIDGVWVNGERVQAPADLPLKGMTASYNVLVAAGKEAYNRATRPFREAYVKALKKARPARIQEDPDGMAPFLIPLSLKEGNLPGITLMGPSWDIFWHWHLIKALGGEVYRLDRKVPVPYVPSARLLAGPEAKAPALLFSASRPAAEEVLRHYVPPSAAGLEEWVAKAASLLELRDAIVGSPDFEETPPDQMLDNHRAQIEGVGLSVEEFRGVLYADTKLHKRKDDRDEWARIRLEILGGLVATVSRLYREGAPLSVERMILEYNLNLKESTGDSSRLQFLWVDSLKTEERDLLEHAARLFGIPLAGLEEGVEREIAEAVAVAEGAVQSGEGVVVLDAAGLEEFGGLVPLLRRFERFAERLVLLGESDVARQVVAQNPRIRHVAERSPDAVTAALHGIDGISSVVYFGPEGQATPVRIAAKVLRLGYAEAVLSIEAILRAFGVAPDLAASLAAGLEEIGIGSQA